MFNFSRIGLLALLLVGLLVVGVPGALAQDPAPPPSADDDTVPIVVEVADTKAYETFIEALFAGFVLIVIVGGYALHRSRADSAKSIPPEVAFFLQGITMTALQIAQKRADITPGELDNQLLNLLKAQLGVATASARDQPPL